jgi:Spy/CpxP family protein refolding chaperone
MTNAERTPRQIRLLTALLLFGTFLSGAVVGAGFYRFSAAPPPRPPHPHAPFLPGPPGALHLTPEQETKAREITDRYRPKLDALMREGFPKFQVINEAMEKEMRELLTPEQVRKLDELKAHRPPMPPLPGRGPGFGLPPEGGQPPEGPPPGMPGR